MTTTIHRFGLLGALVAGLALGCGADENEGTDGETHMHDDEHGGHAEEHTGGKDEIAAALAELSPEDRERAKEQGTCPVSGEKLGSMGKPIRMEHEGDVVFLCCKGCLKKFNADPAKYVARAKGG